MSHLAPSSPPLAHRDRTGNSISILNGNSPISYPDDAYGHYVGSNQSPSSSSSRSGSSSQDNSDSESEEEEFDMLPYRPVPSSSSQPLSASVPELSSMMMAANAQLPSGSAFPGSPSSDRSSNRSSSPPTFRLPSYTKPYDPIIKNYGRGGGRAVDLPLRKSEYDHALRNPGDGSKNMLRGWVRQPEEGEKDDVYKKRSMGKERQEDGGDAKRGRLTEERNGDVAAVASHYNHRPEVGRENRKFSPIFGLKAFNNWIKSVLIAKFARRAIPGGGGVPRNARPRGRVLDLGCGKGGDLLKWNSARIEMYIGFDIAEVSVPITDVITIRQPFDLVTMQFCIHYAFETEQKTRMMLRNVTKNLKLGGMFMGTVPNAEKLVEQLQSIPEDAEALSFGNDVYSVEFDSREEFPIYGHRYSFFLQDAVEDVPEYLVHWENFERLASEYGLRLIYKKEFYEVFDEERDVPEFTDLLGRMKVVDSNGESAMTEDQWEAANLYLAFAFEKI
ncbi:mrna (guanine-n7-)-methyltransferase [Phaffia rhodozyma]|uniref:mRNA cap guanine-N(7) methyltransferase n=1 Tax=Phaffia rhodozyma TaxID=264483 RepID=A0A0F7SVL7_PHARH|nr:mrna (guanine-n7-)-methyltransferase [Phaffia rhodozyma]